MATAIDRVAFRSRFYEGPGNWGPRSVKRRRMTEEERQVAAELYPWVRDRLVNPAASRNRRFADAIESAAYLAVCVAVITHNPARCPLKEWVTYRVRCKVADAIKEELSRAASPIPETDDVADWRDPAEEVDAMDAFESLVRLAPAVCRKTLVLRYSQGVVSGDEWRLRGTTKQTAHKHLQRAWAAIQAAKAKSA